MSAMNEITQIALVLILWLVMGLGFLVKATEMRRQGLTWSDAASTIEGMLFILSVLIPVVILIHRNLPV
jgi:hypothetical protein